MTRGEKQNLAAVIVFFLIPLTLYWLGGGGFERGPALASAFAMSFVSAVCAWGLWGSQ